MSEAMVAASMRCRSLLPCFASLQDAIFISSAPSGSGTSITAGFEGSSGPPESPEVRSAFVSARPVPAPFRILLPKTVRQGYIILMVLRFCVRSVVLVAVRYPLSLASCDSGKFRSFVSGWGCDSAVFGRCGHTLLLTTSDFAGFGSFVSVWGAWIVWPCGFGGCGTPSFAHDLRFGQVSSVRERMGV